MRVVIFGASGQLATDLLITAPNKVELFSFSREECDIINHEQVDELLKKIRPSHVINCAAYHNTSQCEKFPLTAYQINSIAPYYLSKSCVDIDATLTHISTDYVFDGIANIPYLETANTNPINVYGVTKLAGEHHIRSVLDKHYIVRISSVYGKKGVRCKGGTNFVLTMLKKAQEQKTIEVVDDIFMSPTYTTDAAKIIWENLISSMPYGTYHASNKGCCSWYELAERIFKICQLDVDVVPVSHKKFPSSFCVPKNTALETNSSMSKRSWDLALEDFLSQVEK